ncbi:MAG: T9SS C-terminal target domain-containing protein, partial [Bacteroidetes bacterium]
DIAKLKTTDIEGEELTGGYLFRIDKGNHPGWESNFGVVNAWWIPIRFQYRYPDPDSIQPEQETYIQTYVDDFEQAIANSPDFINNQGHHYTDYIELGTFVDNFIVNEVSRNLDAYRLSTYFYKDKNSKIVAGPLWDFNLSFGNGDYCNGEAYTGWMYEEYCGDGNPFWWANMLSDSLFLKTLKCRWSELRQTTLSTPYLLNFIDSMATELELPAQRNFTRWPTLGSYVWPNPWPYPETYEEEISTLKLWIINRMSWMDGMINPIEVDCETFIPTSTENLETDDYPLSVIPNPTTGQFWIDRATQEISGNDLTVIISDLSGQVVYQQKMQAPFPEKLPVNFPSDTPEGIYFLHLKSSDVQQKSSVGKIILIR